MFLTFSSVLTVKSYSFFDCYHFLRVNIVSIGDNDLVWKVKIVLLSQSNNLLTQSKYSPYQSQEYPFYIIGKPLTLHQLLKHEAACSL